MRKNKEVERVDKFPLFFYCKHVLEVIIYEKTERTFEKGLYAYHREHEYCRKTEYFIRCS